MSSGKSRQKALLKNTIIMMVGKFFTQFLSFLLLPLYTRFLATSDYGTIDLILTYISLLVPVITVQQEMATFRYLVDARKDEKQIGNIIRTSLRSTSLRMFCFVLIGLILSIFINLPNKYLILPAMVACAFSNLALQTARGLGRNMQYSIASVLAGIVTITTNFILICLCHFGAESLLIAMTLANLTSCLFIFFSLRITKYLKGGKTSKPLRNSMLKYSWPLVPNGISWWLINASDRTIISIFLGVASNGIYAVANKFPTIIGGFLSVFSMSWTESASLHINDKDRDEFFTSIASNILKLFSSLCILLIAILPLVFNIIVGVDYSEAYNYIPILLLASMGNCMVTIYSAIYVAKKMTKKVASTSIISAIINLVVDLVLIHFIGLYAAAISTVVAYFAMVIYRHYDLKKYVRITYNPRDIVLVALGFISIMTCYYSHIFWLYIIGILMAICYTCIMNRVIIHTAIKKILRK
ncbi:oligosaccharide flippase family protein [Candidatus Saccharibacteria bacterium]|nr:oligosaccharide flippase family protein [Candidatus Saccharibacteria bacterium]